MGQKDMAEKNLESYNDVFADIVNHIFLKGDFIDENRLIDHTTEGIIKDEYGRLFDSLKDIKKKYVDQCEIAIIGIENESSINKYLPIKIMQYEASEYVKQIKEMEDGKRDKIVPVITCVLNFSRKKFNDKQLSSLMDIPEWLDGFVNDYSVRIANVYYLPKEVKDALISDFRIVASVYSNEPDVEVLNDISPKHFDECSDVVTLLTDDPDYRIIFESYLDKRRNVNMKPVGALEKLRQESRAEGSISTSQKIAFKMFDKGYNLAEAREFFDKEDISDEQLEDFYRTYAKMDKDTPIQNGLLNNNRK